MAHGQRLTHIKPQMLQRKTSQLQTIDSFFQALATTGYVIVAGVWLANSPRLVQTPTPGDTPSCKKVKDS
eukprot:2152317-Amphidinium_carterae.2